MATQTKLYRLLRDDEKNPLEDGITAKLPLESKTPKEHIRYGSRICEQSQWISTSRSLSALNVLVRYKRRKEGRFKVCRVVEIDEQKLMEHENKHTIERFLKQISKQMDLVKILSKHSNIVKLAEILLEITTGDILDFTDPRVMEKYIPKDFNLPENKTARGYAKRYSEVLVGRHIPAECCIDIINL